MGETLRCSKGAIAEVGRLLCVSAHPTGRHAEAGRTRQRVDEGEPTLARLETSPRADLSRL
jgi:hypothetical protein